jgi:hypothetical protein
MYRTTSVMALGLFLGLAPIGALAQTDDTDTQQQMQGTQQEMQGTQQEMQTETDTLQTDDQQATDTETLQTDDQQATETETLQTGDDADIATDDMATDVEADVATGDMEQDVIPEQAQTEMLATTLIGAPVNLADESIGTVSDLIIADDNTIRGVVVGVGGFLGIGEKRVALPLNRITVQSTEPGTVELSTDMTREELEEKETFKTAAQIRQEEEAAQAEQQQQQMGTQQPTLE